jgi:hypothetical protein
VNLHVVLVYLRATETDKGKKGVLFALVTEEEWNLAQRGQPPDLASDEEKRNRCYSPKNWKGVMPGQVFRVEAKDAQANTIFPTTQQYLGVWPDEQARIRWRAMDQAIQTSWEMEARKTKDAKQDPLAAALEPLRELYGKIIGSNRKAALLARIITYITR